MIAAALFLALCSGSLFACALFRSRFEQALTVTVLGSNLILYCFGLFDALSAGFAVLLALMLLLCVAALIQLIRTRGWVAFAKRFFTPAFTAYCLLFAAALIGNYARKVSAWDDLTQWADTVKQMCEINKFGASREGFLLYPNYPPAMALWQYFGQSLNRVLTNNTFSEWLLYLSYSSALYVFLVPFFDKLKYKNWFLNLCLLGAAFVLPAALYRSQFRLLDVDPMLGVLAGFGLALAALDSQDGVWRTVNATLTVFTLALIKESGAFFAVVVCAALFVSTAVKNKAETGFSRSRRLIATCAGAVLAAFAWVGWRLYLNANGTYIAFSGKVDLSALWRVVLGSEGGYRQQVWAAFAVKLFSGIFPIGVLKVRISFALLYLALLTLLVLLILRRRKSVPVNRLVGVSAVGAAAVPLFCLGVGVAYLFKFTQEEALALASFARYASVPLITLLTFAFHITVDSVEMCRSKKLFCAVLAALLLFAAPAQETAAFLLGKNRAYAQAVRVQADADAADVFALIGEDAHKINVVSLENDGLDFLLMRFVLRPNNAAGTWYIKEQTFDPATIWYTPPATADEWRERLLADGYEYVLLYDVDDAFVDTFSPAFTDGTAVLNHTLYAVDPATGMLSEVIASSVP